MIRNGLYFYSSKALDGVVGGADGVMVLRDGKMLGGTSFFYFIGTYSSSGGKWKGELTDQEHTPAPAALPTAGKGLVAFGFNGTYTDEGAQFYATALAGKQSLQYHAIMRLLAADWSAAGLTWGSQRGPVRQWLVFLERRVLRIVKA
jgi:hypothetical protein